MYESMSNKLIAELASLVPQINSPVDLLQGKRNDDLSHIWSELSKNKNKTQNDEEDYLK